MLQKPSESFFYRRRYGLAFFAVVIALYYFICVDFMRLPMGLSQPEINSLLASANFSFPVSIIDLPYHILQRASIAFFGISLFSLRLPSIILAILSGTLIIAVLKRFFRSSTALSAGLIIISSTAFLGIARSGSPMIMTVFLLSFSLFAISYYLDKQKTRWLFLALLGLVLAAYSPLGIYFVIFALLIAIFNKKLRTMLLENKATWMLILLSVIALLGLAPLAAAIFYDPKIALDLLGISNISKLSWGDIATNLRALFSPVDEKFYFATPIFDLASVSIAIVGLIVSFRQIKSPRTMFLIIFSISTLILTSIDQNNSYIVLLPMIFLISAGIDFLIQNWYGFFPRNPVARLFGMIPLSILTLGIMLSGYGRYVNNNFYNPNLVYSQDYSFMATRAAVLERSAHKVNLVVPKEDEALYKTLHRDHNNLSVNQKISEEKDTINIVVSAKFNTTDKIPSQIVAGWTEKDSELLRIYEN